MRACVVGVLAVAVVAAVAVAPASAERRVTLKVPRDFRTIQAAIEAAPDGATILLDAGVYEEQLRIEGKSLRIIGSEEGRTVLVGSGREAGILTYAAGGGGELKDLSFVGGAYGIGGERSERGLPAPIALKNVAVEGGFRGIYGSFSSLSAKALAVAGTAWNGISIVFVESVLDLVDVEVHDTGGVGLLVKNHGPGDISIAGHYHHNAVAGVQVSGNNGTVTFLLTVVDHNGLFGIALFGVNAGLGLIAAEDQVDAPPEYNPGLLCEGAGILAADGSVVSVTGAVFRDNCIAISVTAGSAVTVTQNTFNSTNVLLEETVAVFGTLTDGGGNVCGYNLGSPGETVVPCSEFLAGAPQAPGPVGPEALE